MQPEHSHLPGAFGAPHFGSPEGCRSGCAGRSPSKASRLAKIVLGIFILIGLIELLTATDEPELDAVVWFARTGRVGAINSIAFSRDGETLASVDSNGHAVLWDVATGQSSDAQPRDFDKIRSLAFSPDGRIMAGGTLDATIVLWDSESLEVRATLRAHPSPVTALGFSPDGRILASVSGDGTLIFWETTAGYSRIHQSRCASGIASIAFSPDGTSLATSHGNGDLTIRNVATPGHYSVVGRFSNASRGIAFSPDGGTLAASAVSSSQILLWDVCRRRLRASLSGPPTGAPTLAFSPDGRILVVTGSDGTLHVTDLIAELANSV